ncbi:HAD-IC family P-type ATPase, partial [Limobrevibacterium gyesilva]
LGSRAFAGDPAAAPAQGPELWLARPGHAPLCLRFDERLRADAAACVARLRAMGLQVMLASGDRSGPVAAVAVALGITDWQAERSPVEKVALVEGLRGQGRRVLMVGDGVNDGPSLAAASVSASPSSAADVSQTVADMVFQGSLLAPVAEAVAVARRARAVMRQNIALSICYNAVMLPLAVAGFVTPWLAAAAMSSSSLVVMANSLRVRGRRA